MFAHQRRRVFLAGLAVALILEDDEEGSVRAPKRWWERPYIQRRHDDTSNTMDDFMQELLDVSSRQERHNEKIYNE